MKSFVILWNILRQRAFGLLLALVLIGWTTPVFAQSTVASDSISSPITNSIESSAAAVSDSLLSDSLLPDSLLPDSLLKAMVPTDSQPDSPANSPTNLPADQSPTVDSTRLFELHCAGCHIHGGNIVRRGKNLKLKTLQKNQMDSIEAIAQIITLGRGNMSAYQDRLTPEQIQELASYVLEQAQQGWPN